MRHNLTLEGHAFRLRPVTDEDAGRIVELRGDPELNRYLHVSASQLDEQLTWLVHYYERPGDYYFVVERRTNGGFEGLIAIYDIDLATKQGVWGRWILKQNSLAAVESVWLIYRIAFELLGLTGARSQTITDNISVVSFHESCGITSRRLLPGHFKIGERYFDAIEHWVTRETWPTISLRLEQLSRFTARKIVSG